MNLFRWIFRKLSGRTEYPPEIARARQLIAAMDAGGIPLDPRRITRIAEDLGLEVSRNARTNDTIERIRAAINRS
ncbi:hypothetical protein GALL_354470 [mine drainage metagenome]|uniref:Uncharacterized protein n=1 Tax=mine drainage metagenome TaxID=410659 RepID=A0A1J5QZ83_9ZZZZ